MKTIFVAATAVLLVGLAQAVWAVPRGIERGKRLTALEQKMLGAWKGRIGCDGRFVFRADGTYELTGYGPAQSDSAGTWRVRGGTLPSTLVLTCKTSEVTGQVGKIEELQLIKLDDKGFAIAHAEQSMGHYTRVKK